MKIKGWRFFSPSKNPEAIQNKDMPFFLSPKEWEEIKVHCPNFFRRRDLSWHVFFANKGSIIEDSIGMAKIHYLIKRYVDCNHIPTSPKELDGLMAYTETNHPSDETQSDDADFVQDQIDPKTIETLEQAIQELKERILQSNSIEEKENIDNQLKECEKFYRDNTFQGRPKQFSVPRKLKERNQKNIKDTIKRIERIHKPLAKHLSDSIKWSGGHIYSPTSPQKWEL